MNPMENLLEQQQHLTKSRAMVIAELRSIDDKLAKNRTALLAVKAAAEAQNES